MKDYLETMVAAFTILGGFAAIIWRLAQVKGEIEKSIDSLKDYSFARITATEHRLDLHLTEYAGKKELIEYRLNGHDEAIDHKFKRCWDEIKDIQGHLAKDGFIPRNPYSPK